uniref:Uncharacterized protein n=1 Tax=Panagrolaimus sp. ES5 TaxID=591445 RepID=A0AC34FDH9_9BILA
MYLEIKAQKLRESNFNPLKFYNVTVDAILKTRTELANINKYEKPSQWPLSYERLIDEDESPDVPAKKSNSTKKSSKQRDEQVVPVELIDNDEENERSNNADEQSHGQPINDAGSDSDCQIIDSIPAGLAQQRQKRVPKFEINGDDEELQHGRVIRRRRKKAFSFNMHDSDEESITIARSPTNSFLENLPTPQFPRTKMQSVAEKV